MDGNTQGALGRALADLNDAIRMLAGIGGSRPKLIEELLHGRDTHEPAHGGDATRVAEANPS